MKDLAATFQDRELTWLDFDTRVLELTEDPTIPLLERVRFLAIFSSNLDEFFMVRVASLKAKIERGVTAPNSAGYTPKELLKIVLQRTQELVGIQAERFRDVIVPELAQHGIEFLKISELSQDERDHQTTQSPRPARSLRREPNQPSSRTTLSTPISAALSTIVRMPSSL